MNKVIIDVESKGRKVFIRALSRLKGTEFIKDCGEYYFGGSTGYNKLEYIGKMNAAELDAWAYKVKCASCFVGAVDDKEV
jgi:hypothetical protein